MEHARRDAAGPAGDAGQAGQSCRVPTGSGCVRVYRLRDDEHDRIALL